MTHVDSPAPTCFELCRGVGMFGEAVKLVFPAARTLCSAEWESYANAAQLARMADASLECHPVWIGDIAGLDARHLLGLVDLLAAGLPCQPYSCAGKRIGNKDHRSWGKAESGKQKTEIEEVSGPIPHFLRIVGECRPAVVFLENVAAWVRSTDQWFRPVGDELCRMGYALVDPVFLAASDVGASHERERVFLLAVATEQRERWQQLSESARRLGQGDSHGGGGEFFDAERLGQSRPLRTQLRDDGTGFSGKQNSAMAHPRGHLQGRQHEPRRNSEGRIPPQRHSCQLAQPARRGQRELRQPSGGHRQPDRRERQLADTEESRRQGPEPARRIRPDGCPPEHGGTMGDAGSPHSSGCQPEQQSGIGLPGTDQNIFAPGPGDLDGWRRVVTDGTYDYRSPAVEPGLRVLVDGLALVVDAARADHLRCAGNGVVALQAAVALVALLGRAGELTP